MSIDAARSLAARVAARAELRDVRIWESESSLAQVPVDDANHRLAFQFEPEIQVQHEPNGGVLIVYGLYDLTLHSVDVRDGGGDEVSESGKGDADPNHVASVSFRMGALFTIDDPSGEPFSEDELTAFAETTGTFALYPYAREFVADATSRMGLPPLHMGVLRLGLESRTGD